MVDLVEVLDGEVGVGQIVQITVLADEEGYVGAPGTLVNGVPLSSDRVDLLERGGGLYELSYLVDAGDSDVPVGTLEVGVLADAAGNLNAVYQTVETNALEVYTDPRLHFSPEHLRFARNKPPS
ncbi:MAG: hypothetical protein R2751_16165 [Bacteroidales bacterium]